MVRAISCVDPTRHVTVPIQAQSLLPVHNGVVYICTLEGCGSLTSY